MSLNSLPYLAALVTAAAPAYLLRFSIFGVPTTALEILIYLFVTAVLLAQWGRFRPIPRSITWPVALFLLAAFISTAIAPDKRVALGILKAWIFDPILFAWALCQIPDREKLTKSVLTGLTAGGLFVALVAIFQRLTGQVAVDGRVIGPYAWSPVENPSPNYLALYLAPLAVLAFGLATQQLNNLTTKKRFSVLQFSVFSVSFLLMLLAILLSYSRGGLGAVAVGVFAVLVLRFWSVIRRRMVWRLGVAALVIALAIGGWFYIRPNPALSPEEGGRITASNNVRWEIWRTTVSEVLSGQSTVLSLPNWITGVGLGNYQNYFTELTRGRVNYDRIAPLALTPHNLFLALWVNLGLPGLIAFVWILYEFFRAGLRALQRSLPLSLSPSIPLMAAMLALLAHGLLDTPYFKNDLSFIFWTLIVLLLLLAENKRTEVTK